MHVRHIKNSMLDSNVGQAPAGIADILGSHFIRAK